MKQKIGYIVKILMDLCEKYRGLNQVFPASYPIKLALVATAVMISGCEERYWPEFDGKYENLLVVDGMITNEPGPYIVKISLATSVEYPVYHPVSGYKVTIMDDRGYQEVLSETEPGTYRSDSSGLKGQVGFRYRLQVESPEGDTYLSEFEELKVPVGVDSVFVNAEYREHEDYDYAIQGYQFYVNTRLAEKDSNYYLYDLERTYEYHSDFPIYFWYDGKLHVFPDADSLNVCWKTDKIFEIFTGTTSGLSEPVLTSFPLHFVYFNNREFSVRYSLLIRQLTISERAYEFWNSVREQNFTGDDIYMKMPYQVRGNMSNLFDPDEPVLGYFMVAGMDERRLFFDRPGYPVEMDYWQCVLSIADYEEYGWMFRIIDKREFPIYVTMDGSGRRAVPNPACVDCQRNGGTLEKPDFWTSTNE